MSTSEYRIPTRADVARLAGTSLATVSYVVNDGPKHVAEKTRRRVVDAIEALGYRPNSIALALRNSSTNSIGMMVPNFRGPYFADLMAEIEQEVAERGKIVIFGSTGFSPKTERELLRTFSEHRVDAVLSIGPTIELQPQERFNGALNVIQSLDGDQEPITIEIAQRAATREAALHLVDHGRQRVAAIFGPTAHGVFNVRYRGWRDAMRYSQEQTKELVRRADYSFQGGFDAVMDLFKHATTRPDALLVTNDTQATGALSALNQLGVRIPEEVAVVSIDSTELSPFLSPPLTSISQPANLLAKAALDIVDGIKPKLSTVNADSPRNFVLPHELIVRQSCGCTPES